MHAQILDNVNSELIIPDKNKILFGELESAKHLIKAGNIFYACGLVLNISTMVAAISSADTDSRKSDLGAGEVAMMITGSLATTVGPALSAGGAYKLEQAYKRNNQTFVGKNVGSKLYGIAWTFKALGTLGALTGYRVLNIIGIAGQELFSISSLVSSFAFVTNNASEKSDQVNRSIKVSPVISNRDGIGLKIEALF